MNHKELTLLERNKTDIYNSNPNCTFPINYGAVCISSKLYNSAMTRNYSSTITSFSHNNRIGWGYSGPTRCFYNLQQQQQLILSHKNLWSIINPQQSSQGWHGLRCICRNWFIYDKLTKFYVVCQFTAALLPFPG